MSDAHSESFIKTPKQLLIVVSLALLVPIAVIGLIVSYVTTGAEGDKSAMTAEAIEQRIRPVAGFELASATAPAAGGQAAAAAPGKALYDTVCAGCHGAGVAGAPKLGDKAAWAPRIAAGMNTMVTTAIKGKGAMPPRGGRADASDADIKAVVEYMVGAAR